jgi:cytochrome c-type biogenesis protein CcmF
MEIDYKGEHLLPGSLGQFFVILAFGAALLSTISYYYASLDKNKFDNSWQRLGRIGFYLNSISILGIGACLFYIIYNHYFEYHYAWAHSSTKLPVYYIISCFWEGQEGSFWLWAFWQAVLGNILIWKAKSWERPVMTVVGLSQVFLASMLIGVTIVGARVGSSPFILLRDAVDGPIFERADYLGFIKDGNGLNPLLQNYWMVIHPPTLFLGFASMIVPFAYAIAGLWRRRYDEWIKPAISYSLFAVMVLGAGIIMGSFWAYEALNFGGFWAWDPVENASLIPWLTLIGGVHVLIVYKNSKHAYFTATFLVLISFVLVLYASFLTRSGILGESSVHAFTDLGMFWHLVLFIAVFAFLAIGVVVARWKELPISQKDEETYSREFWMFVGAVFLTLACFHLLLVTSIPVINAVFSSNFAPPVDPVKHYNVIQSAFAVVISILMGVTQFLKYKKSDPVKFATTTGIYLLVSLLVTGIVAYLTRSYSLPTVFLLVMFAGIFTILANSKILAEAFKGKIKLAGSAVAHIGFGLLLVGGLIAAGTNTVVSVNKSGIGYGEEFEKNQKSNEYIRLNQGEPIKMAQYTVTYLGDSVVSPNTYFKVNYKVIDEKTNKIKENFTLFPNAQANKKMGLIASPDTKHYLFHDLYTHVGMAPIKYIEDEEEEDHGDHPGHDEHKDDKNFDKPLTYEVSVGDTIRFRKGYVVLRGLNTSVKVENITLTQNDVAVGAQLEIFAFDDKNYSAEPVFMVRGGAKFDFSKRVEEMGLKFRFSNVYPDKDKIEIMLYQTPEGPKPYIVMKAIAFPFINFFWAGTILMVIGFLMAILRRNKELKTT